MNDTMIREARQPQNKEDLADDRLHARPGSYRKHLPRVVIVGLGLVGSTTAFALVNSDIPAQIILVNRDRRKAEGHAQDLQDAEVFLQSDRVAIGDFDDCYSADVIIVAVGVGQANRTSRLDGLRETAATVRLIVEDIADHNPRAILLIASNPVDVMTYVARKWSGLPATRVIGSGTTLDTSRLRRRIAAGCGVAANNIHAYVVGEHGDSQVALLSSARIAGMPLQEFLAEHASQHGPAWLTDIVSETRTAGGEIILAKGATYFGIATALVEIVRAILQDENVILTVSSVMPDAMQLGDVALSMPSVVNREGLSHVLSVPLSDSERQALRASAAAIRSHIVHLGDLE